MAPSINLGRRGRKALKLAGFIALGLVAFVFAIQATFNYDRVVKRYFVDALAGSYDVTVGKIERGLMPGVFTMERVRIQARPTKADEVPPLQLAADEGLGPRLGWNTWIRSQPLSRDADDAFFEGEEFVDCRVN